jgi:hypothetical protein
MRFLSAANCRLLTHTAKLPKEKTFGAKEPK